MSEHRTPIVNQQVEEETPEQKELRRKIMQNDFMVGVTTRHLRIPGGLQRTDYKSGNK
jgi:hypothetical protein